MRMSEYYDLYSFGMWRIIISRNVGDSHGLWVVSFNQCLGSGFCRVFGAFLCVQTRAFFAEIMGGKRKRVEPPSCAEWRKKTEVWDILRRGNFTDYMERLKGNNPAITHQFVKSWKDGSVLVGNQRMEVTEDIIAEATGLALDGTNFYRERKLSDKAIGDFVESEQERNRLVKIGNSYFNPASVSRPWRFVFFVIMEYLTLDGRYTKLYG